MSGVTFEDGTDLPRTGVVLPDRPSMDGDAVLELASRAERAGVESVWCWDGWGYNPFVTLGRIAERTDLPLGTGIANAYGYTPATLAMNALSLHDATGGRFVLGLGASTPTLVEGVHGQQFDRPVRRLRELIEIVRLALAGDPLDYDGQVFDLDGFGLVHAGCEVPIFTAALGEVNTAMTVAHADGYMPNFLPFEEIGTALEDARERAGIDGSDDGRDRTGVHVAPHVTTAVDEDAALAREMAARSIALHVGDVEVYGDVLSRHGFESEVSAVRDHWSAGEREAAVETVTDEMIDAVTLAGTPRDVQEGIADLLDGAVDTVIATFPGSADGATIRRTVDAVGNAPLSR